MLWETELIAESPTSKVVVSNPATGRVLEVAMCLRRDVCKIVIIGPLLLTLAGDIEVNPGPGEYT